MTGGCSFRLRKVNHVGSTPTKGNHLILLKCFDSEVTCNAILEIAFSLFDSQMFSGRHQTRESCHDQVSQMRAQMECSNNSKVFIPKF